MALMGTTLRDATMVNYGGADSGRMAANFQRNLSRTARYERYRRTRDRHRSTAGTHSPPPAPGNPRSRETGYGG